MSVVAVDKFATNQDSLLTSFTRFDAVSPSDSDELAYVSRGILFSGAGDLVVVRIDGTTVTIPSGILAANVWHPMRVKQVKSTGTAATGIWVGD